VRPAEPDQAPAPAATTAGQATLFGGDVEPPAPPREPRRPRKTENADLASPLASLPPADAADSAAALATIREDIGDCRRCRLCEKRTNIVFGVGNPQARLMFVGEGPGADEDAQGEPFVGRAGQLLTKIIEAMQMGRPDVYIANIVKCRPPENRTPLPDEVSTCAPFLFRQIAAIRPRVIVCLGTPAAQTLLGTRETITRMRGIFRVVDGIKVMPTFHPAYLLRNPAAKREVWEDMKQVMAALQAG
jgi:DNA polymerase